MNENGWKKSAQAWIAEIGDHGDWGRRTILDAVMLQRVRAGGFSNALDVGCGEGRFCRMLREQGVGATGIDPTEELLMKARERDPQGDYLAGYAEQLPFPDASFDLVVSYLTLIDIDDFRAGLREMHRVLQPGGAILVANLASFFTSHEDGGWQNDGAGQMQHYKIDRYLEERPNWESWRGIEVINWHRPLSAYMKAFLELDMHLTFFDEPAPPVESQSNKAQRYRRLPWYMAMEWAKTRA